MEKYIVHQVGEINTIFTLSLVVGGCLLAKVRTHISIIFWFLDMAQVPLFMQVYERPKV